MPQRKIWSEEEDRILRYLKEQRGERKWANIGRLMESQFGIIGRTGKQCRQRYHNHLDANIVNTDWTYQEEQILYQMHEQIGNRWSAISQKLPGRSDNCVKNHFYSKLRKSIRKLNKIIGQYFSQGHKQINEKILSKIIQTQQSKFKTSSKIDEQLAEFCRGIKNRLFNFEGTSQQTDSEELQIARQLVLDIERFQNNYKKGYKALKKSQYEHQSQDFLKPPTSKLKRSSSVSSQKSDSSYLSSNSNSYISSCSDLSQYDNPCEDNKISKTTGSLRNSSGVNSDIVKPDKPEQKQRNHSNFYYDRMDQDGVIQMNIQKFNEQHQNLIEENCNLGIFFYENTPFRARILCPSEKNEIDFPLIHPASDNEDFIEYKQQRDFEE